MWPYHPQTKCLPLKSLDKEAWAGLGMPERIQPTVVVYKKSNTLIVSFQRS